MEQKKYLIGGKEFTPKARYSLKDWGRILRIVGNVDTNDNLNALTTLLVGDNVRDLLGIIFTEPVNEEIYEEDFQEASRAINDFFGRKDSLMRNIKAGSPNSTEKPSSPQDNSNSSPILQ
jgi:hypothetical protein